MVKRFNLYICNQETLTNNKNGGNLQKSRG